MGLELLLQGAIGVVGATLAAVVVWCHKRSQPILAFSVGVAAGLIDIKFSGVHAFTILVALYGAKRISLGRTDAPSLAGFRRAFLLVSAASLLSLTALTGDLVNSGGLALQLLALAVSAGALVALTESPDSRRMLAGLLTTTTVASGVAVGQVVHLIPTELWHTHVSSVGRPVGIYSEPDWLGLYAAIGLLLAWRLKMPARVRLPVLALHALATLLAFARAAWMAIAVVSVVWAIERAGSKGPERANRSRGALVAALAALLIAVVVPISTVAEFRADIGRRVARTFHEAPDVSAVARIEQWKALRDLGSSSFPIGHGISASGRVGVMGDIDYHGTSRNNVASNWILGLWVDGGLLALPLIATFVVVSMLGRRRTAGGALVVVLVNSLFSNALFFPVTWLSLALCLAKLESPYRSVTQECQSFSPYCAVRRSSPSGLAE